MRSTSQLRVAPRSRACSRRVSSYTLYIFHGLPRTTAHWADGNRLQVSFTRRVCNEIRRRSRARNPEEGYKFAGATLSFNYWDRRVGVCNWKRFAFLYITVSVDLNFKWGVQWTRVTVLVAACATWLIRRRENWLRIFFFPFYFGFSVFCRSYDRILSARVYVERLSSKHI